MDEALVVVVRGTIAFFTLLIFARLLGKQQMANLTFFDYINGITIGSMAGTLATDLSTKAWAHWVGLATFVALTFLFQFVTLKNRKLAQVVDGQPVTVIANGKILEKNLARSRIKIDDLLMMLRQKNIFDITQVAYAIYEPDGSLSVLPKAEYQPVTPKDLGLSVEPAGLMTELIVDGHVLEENLSKRNKDKAWLKRQLKAQGVGDVKEVSLAALLPGGRLYVDKYFDGIGDESIYGGDGPGQY